MNKKLAEYYGEFMIGLQNDLKHQVKLIKELEIILSWVHEREAREKLYLKILKEKTMVNVICKACGKEPEFPLEPNEYMEIICKLELRNALLKYTTNALIKDLGASMESKISTLLEKHFNLSKDKKEKASNDLTKIFAISDKGKLDLKDDTIFKGKVDSLNEHNSKLEAFMKEITDKPEKKKPASIQKEILPQAK